MGQTFEELVGLHLDALYSAALCFTLDEGHAEELLQETAIRAFHEFSRRRREADFRLAILEVLVGTYLQRQRRSGQDPLAVEWEQSDELMRPELQPDIAPFPEPGSPGYRMLRAWMSQVWSELQDGDRLILWLADVERLRHGKVAAIVGLDEHAVRSRHYRARLRLSRGAADTLGRGELRGREA